MLKFLLPRWSGTIAEIAQADFGAQKAMRNFLKARACYEVLPLSFRLIELDVSLTVKESLNILVQNGGQDRT